MISRVFRVRCSFLWWFLAPSCCTGCCCLDMWISSLRKCLILFATFSRDCIYHIEPSSKHRSFLLCTSASSDLSWPSLFFCWTQAWHPWSLILFLPHPLPFRLTYIHILWTWKTLLFWRKELNKLTCTFLEVLHNFSVLRFNTVSWAFARPWIGQLIEPVKSTVVDGFSNVETKIESAVIGTSKDEHELSSFVLHLCDFEFRIFLFEGVGINQSRFMPQMLRTFAEVLRKVDLGFLLKNVPLIGRNAIPKFAFSLMKEVDGWEVKVLLMPTEHGLPWADIAVRGGNTSYLDINSMVKKGVKWVQVPFFRPLIHKCVQQVGSIDGRREDNIFPKLY